MKQHKYCSEFSNQNLEPLYGTATPTRIYLLLEYPRPWGPKAIVESNLPASVKAWLNELDQNLPDSKVLLVRQDSKPEIDDLHFFMADCQAEHPSLYEFRLERYEDLLNIDIPSIMTGEPAIQAVSRHDPLLLVCTHGRRDACCALHGLPVYSALRDAVTDTPDQIVWQVSHVGGHRFAANLVCLPHGLLYGRVNPEIGVSILESYKRGHVHLSNLRGRTSYSKIAQAAEYYLWKQNDDTRVDAYHLLGTSEISPSSWQVQFKANNLETIYTLTLVVEDTGRWVYQGCEFDKQAAVIDYKLVAYEKRMVEA